MGIMALYPKPITSRSGKGHKIYPYLLKNMAITRPNQVWAADICYIPMAKGFFISCRHHGLVQSQGLKLARIEFPGE